VCYFLKLFHSLLQNPSKYNAFLYRSYKIMRHVHTSLILFLLSFVELGRFHGRVTSSGLVLQRTIFQCICILLAWNSTDRAGKKYYNLTSVCVQTYIFYTRVVYIKKHNIIPGRKCERRSLGLRLGRNSCLISALSGLHHCHS
jgi:hypothetical protein